MGEQPEEKLGRSGCNEGPIDGQSVVRARLLQPATKIFWVRAELRLFRLCCCRPCSLRLSDFFPAHFYARRNAGFAAEEYLDGIERPRYMALGPSKELLIADTRPNGVIWLVQGKNKKALIEKAASQQRPPARQTP